MAGRPRNHMMKMNEVPRHTSLVPLASPCFANFVVYRSGRKANSRLPGSMSDHFCCAAEPSSGHPLSFLSLNFFFPWLSREVLHGVGMKFPIFAVNCSRFPLPSERKREQRSKMKKSEEKKTKKTKKRRKQNKNKRKDHSSHPIYTNPVKNLPINSKQRIFLGYLCVFLWFFQGLSGFGRGQQSLVNLRLFP